jgi:hypothetical protein
MGGDGGDSGSGGNVCCFSDVQVLALKQVIPSNICILFFNLAIDTRTLHRKNIHIVFLISGCKKKKKKKKKKKTLCGGSVGLQI